MRDAIVAAAAGLFQERGFAATSMQEIADAVGLTRPALYYHFRNKEEVLESLVEKITLKSIRNTLLIDVRGSGDPAATLRSMVVTYALWILRHPQHFAVLSRDEKELPERARLVQRQGRRELLNAYVRVIRNGVSSGRFRAVDPVVTALSMFGMCNATAQWFKADQRLSESQVADTIADLATTMVLRPVSADSQRPTDALAWLHVLKDDVARLEKALHNQSRARPGA